MEMSTITTLLEIDNFPSWEIEGSVVVPLEL